MVSEKELKMTIDQIKEDLQRARAEAAEKWKTTNSPHVSAEGMGQTKAYDHALGLLGRFTETPRREQSAEERYADELDANRDHMGES